MFDSYLEQLDFNKEIILEQGSQDWNIIKKKIDEWKKRGGILNAKLVGEKTETKTKEKLITEQTSQPENEYPNIGQMRAERQGGSIKELHNRYLNLSPEQKALELYTILAEEEATREFGNLTSEQIKDLRITSESEFWNMNQSKRDDWIKETEETGSTWSPYDVEVKPFNVSSPDEGNYPIGEPLMKGESGISERNSFFQKIKTPEEKARQLYYIQYEIDLKDQFGRLPTPSESESAQDKVKDWENISESERQEWLSFINNHPESWVPFSEFCINKRHKVGNASIPQGDFYHKDVGWY